MCVGSSLRNGSEMKYLDENEYKYFQQHTEVQTAVGKCLFSSMIKMGSFKMHLKIHLILRIPAAYTSALYH